MNSLSIGLCLDYDDCLQSISNGTYDVLEWDLALDSHFYGKVLTKDYLDPKTFEIMTMYNCSHSYSMMKQRKIEISESIFCFPSSVWALIFVFLALQGEKMSL